MQKFWIQQLKNQLNIYQKHIAMQAGQLNNGTPDKSEKGEQPQAGTSGQKIRKPLRKDIPEKERVFKFQPQNEYSTLSTDVFSPPPNLTLGQVNNRMAQTNTGYPESAPKMLYGYQGRQQNNQGIQEFNSVSFSPIEQKLGVVGMRDQQTKSHIGIPQQQGGLDESFLQLMNEMAELNLTQNEQSEYQHQQQQNQLRLQVSNPISSIPQTNAIMGFDPIQQQQILQQQQELLLQFQQMLLLKQLQQSQSTLSPMNMYSLQQQQQLQHQSQILQNSFNLSHTMSPQYQVGHQNSRTSNILPQFDMGKASQTPEPSFEQITDDMTLAVELDDLWGNQIVSRKLQKIIESGRDDQKEIIVSKLERLSPQIERDVFGNYVVQKVFEKCNDTLRTRMFHRLKGYFVDLSKNQYGCRVIQKIIEFVSHRENLLQIFVEEVKDNLKALVLDNNANYVLHKMLEALHKDRIRFFLPEIEGQVNVLVQRNYGCKIILKCFEIYEQQDINGIQENVVGYLDVLGETEPGNYIIQYLIRRGTADNKKMVKNFILRQFVTLSMNKYASNTVEKQVEVLDREEFRILTQSLMLPNPQIGNITFLHLSVHQYGSYVMKTLLVLQDKQTIKPVLQFFQQNPSCIMYLNMNTFGQRILQILNKQNI